LSEVFPVLVLMKSRLESPPWPGTRPPDRVVRLEFAHLEDDLERGGAARLDDGGDLILNPVELAREKGARLITMSISSAPS